MLALSLSDTYGINRFVSTCFPHQSIPFHPHHNNTQDLFPSRIFYIGNQMTNPNLSSRAYPSVIMVEVTASKPCPAYVPLASSTNIFIYLNHSPRISQIKSAQKINSAQIANTPIFTLPDHQSIRQVGQHKRLQSSCQLCIHTSESDRIQRCKGQGFHHR